MAEREHPFIEVACDRARRGTGAPTDAVVRAVADALARPFPTASVSTVGTGPGWRTACEVGLSEWNDPGFDPQRLDDRLARTAERGRLRLRVLLDGEGDPARATAQILTRAQRYLDRRNVASTCDSFDRVLSVHRALHDLELPLVRADYAHALDVWQWTLRLDPEASLAVQLAALFHDVERLRSEPVRRIEQHAPDYAAFKRAHAQGGADLARRVLGAAGVAEAVTDRVAVLVAAHEDPNDDPDQALVRDADALSFFSLNSAGFVDFYGREHARRKIDHTLRRASPECRAILPSLRLRSDVARLLEEAER